MVTALAKRAARAAAFAALRGWSHGCVAVRLPDGSARVVGDPRSAERAEVRVKDDAFFARLLLRGEMGAGESYTAGEWDSDDLVGAIRLFLRNLPDLAVETPVTALARLPARARHALRGNTKRQSARNVRAHYDLGNDFYALMLDETMAYSCAVFEGARDALADAQRNKFERVCRKLDLRPTDRVLEIGCGWGGFAMHAARTRGCRVTAVTVSRAQHELARARVDAAGLGRLVDVQLRDYRDVAGRYDKVVSIEMLEAVGHAHLDAFFARCGAALAPDGAMLVQTIAMPDHRYEAYRRGVDWTQAYVFPGVLIPSLAAITGAMSRATRLTVRHLEDIGDHYAPTLCAWRERFLANRAAVRALGFDDAFLRTWEMYLAFSEAAFSERALGDLQIVFAGPANRAQLPA